jgi:hypothetical protein
VSYILVGPVPSSFPYGTLKENFQILVAVLGGSRVRLIPPAARKSSASTTARRPSRKNVSVHLCRRLRPGEVSGGVCGGIGNGGYLVSILSLDKHTYVFGDEVVYRLQIRALTAQKIPVAFSIVRD